MTRRGLLALSLAVVALATAVALDRPRRAAPDEPGRFFPGLAPASVRRIEIRAPSRPPLVLERTSEELTLPGLPTDRDAVRDLVASLALLASRRRAPAGPGHGLETPRLEVGVTDDKGTRVLLVGNREPALGRVWAALRGAPEHHLVDDWAARAVDRTADDLRRRAPFAGGDVASVRLEAGGTTIDIAGRPAGVAVPGGRALADHRKLAALIGRIEELRALRFVAAAEGTASLILTVDGETLRALGDCAAGERLAASPVGAICLPSDAVAALEKLASSPLEWVERGPFAASPGAVRAIDLRPAAGPTLHLERAAGAWLLDGKRIDDTAVDGWLRELAAVRATSVASAAPVAARPAGADEIAVQAGGAPEVAWLAGGTIRRPGEPIALAAPRGTERFFRADPVEFADRTVLSFEPSALADVDIDGERAVRGASLDDWSLRAPVVVAADSAAIDKLRETLAALRARKVAAARSTPEHGLAPPRHVVTLGLAPAPGQERGETHVLEIGAETATGACYARRRGDGPVYLLGPDDCRALAAHLATRQVLVASSVQGAALDGRPLEPDELAALARALARAPAVVGYGPLPGRELVLDTTEGPVALTFARHEYARKDRPVRYRVPADACDRWPSLCETVTRR
ncbi:MAG TPA: DUF4340 domain-containing protein [Haliangiales bacterium]|nr:DUF4340 domain-containing protein [Haliangiales bacterium]